MASSIARHVQDLQSQGYRVIAASTSWKDSMGLLTELGAAGVSPVAQQALALDALCRKVEDGQRSGVPFFDQPTVVVVGNPKMVSDLGLDTRWQTVVDAAQRAPNPVVLLEAQRMDAIFTARSGMPKP
jgi:hypothetical protein